MSSLFILLISVYLSLYPPQGSGDWLLLALILGTIASSIFFPLLIGIYIEYLKEEKEGEAIWRIFKEFFEGGILRVYKDREESDSDEDGVDDLRKSFDRHKKGTIKLVGVSLRVFFSETSPFYNNIKQLCENSDKINMKVLICSSNSPELLNRAKIESPNNPDNPAIKIDILQAISSINNINNKYNSPIDYGFYTSAPYCTLVIFPDKCYFSPNILSSQKPVRLPMIVFSKESNGYRRLDEYFDYLFNNKVIS